MRRASEPLLWLAIALTGIAAGLLYSYLFQGVYAAGAVYGFSAAMLILSYERGYLLPKLQRRIRALPAPIAIPLTELGYVAMVTIAFVIAGLVVWSFSMTQDTFMQATMPSVRVMIYSLAISAAIVFVLRVRDLLGAEVFTSFFLARYHRPVQEERIFLFLDMVGSTKFAERYGDVRAQEFLAAFFVQIAEPVRRHRGAVADYVGDMALVTWPLARGIENANCACCIFAIREAIDNVMDEWLERFGEVPRFRAALHAGPVVTAEVGVDRHKIAFFGDTVNVTGRLEALCKAVEESVLVSSDLLSRLPALPPEIVAVDLGAHPLRGRDQPLKVAALRGREDNVVSLGARSMAAR